MCCIERAAIHGIAAHLPREDHKVTRRFYGRSTRSSLVTRTLRGRHMARLPREYEEGFDGARQGRVEQLTGHDDLVVARMEARRRVLRAVHRVVLQQQAQILRAPRSRRGTVESAYLPVLVVQMVRVAVVVGAAGVVWVNQPIRAAVDAVGALDLELRVRRR